jgi:hypothetical protein
MYNVKHTQKIYRKSFSSERLNVQNKHTRAFIRQVNTRTVISVRLIKKLGGMYVLLCNQFNFRLK